MAETEHEQPEEAREPEASMPRMKDYGSAAAFADEVRNWMTASHCWNICCQMAAMHSYAYMASYMNGQPGVFPQMPFAVSSVAAQPGQPSRISQRRSIPSFSRRILAELIDSVFAFAVKLFIVYTLVELNAIDLEKYDRLLSDEADLQSLIDVTQELFPIEMFGKFVISVVEALFISYGWGSVPGGSTPGKAVMGIQVVSCHEITSIPGTEEVMITRDLNVSFKNSLLRSVIKNMIISLLFPLSAAAYAFNYNRAIYDLAAKTIVVYI